MADEDLVRILQEQLSSEQTIQNFSFDREFKLLIVEMAGYNQATDSIKRVAVDNLGKLLVSLAGTTSVWEYAEITSIASGATSTILTYTVTSTELFLDQVIASGDIDAEYTIVVDGSTKARYKTSEQNRTAQFIFTSPQRVAVGSIIDIKVTHFQTGSSGNFNTALIGHK